MHSGLLFSNRCSKRLRHTANRLIQCLQTAGSKLGMAADAHSGRIRFLKTPWAGAVRGTLFKTVTLDPICWTPYTKYLYLISRILGLLRGGFFKEYRHSVAVGSQ